MKLIRFILVVFGIFVFLGILSSIFRGCGTSEYKKNPVDKLIKEMNQVDEYSIMLYDMNKEGSFTPEYYHNYQVVKNEDGEIVEEKTGWRRVSKDFFDRHRNHMGMVITTKSPDEGVVRKVSPPGYDNYIGNDQYGRWRTNSSGDSFWEFYGKYAMLSTLFDLGGNPVRRSYYRNYRDRFSSGGVYYGPSRSGSRLYGTSGRYTKSRNMGSVWSSKASNRSFKEKVRGRVSKSSGRYSSSSFRSRSSGFGK